jgi:hypothetical protein
MADSHLVVHESVYIIIAFLSHYGNNWYVADISHDIYYL